MKIIEIRKKKWIIKLTPRVVSLVVIQIIVILNSISLDLTIVTHSTTNISIKYR